MGSCKDFKSMTKGEKKPKRPSIALLDRLWSELVKIRAGGKCEYCGKVTTLNSHHLFSRSNRSTRWDVENGVSLCVYHHTFGNFSAHKSPFEFSEWIQSVRGEEWYQSLRRKASTAYKPDYWAVKEGLVEEQERLKN